MSPSKWILTSPLDSLPTTMPKTPLQLTWSVTLNCLNSCSSMSRGLLLLAKHGARSGEESGSSAVTLGSVSQALDPDIVQGLCLFGVRRRCVPLIVPNYFDVGGCGLDHQTENVSSSDLVRTEQLANFGFGHKEKELSRFSKTPHGKRSVESTSRHKQVPPNTPLS